MTEILKGGLSQAWQAVRRWRTPGMAAALVVLVHLLALRAWQAGIAPPHWRPGAAIELVPVAQAASSAPAAVTPAVGRAAIPSAIPPPAPTPGPSPVRSPATAAGANGTSASAPARAAAAPALAQAAPPLRLHYVMTGKARGFPVSGEATLDWRPEGGRYEADLDLRLRPAGSRHQHSEGWITPQGLAPLKFIDRARHEEATHFDRAGARVVFSSNQPQAALEPGTQDRLSLLLQLGALATASPQRLSAGTLIEVPTASARELETWQLRVDGPQDLQLPGGPLRAVRLVRAPRHDHDATLELWLAPSLHYSPVRLRLTYPGGDWVDQAWSRTDRP